MKHAMRFYWLAMLALLCGCRPQPRNPSCLAAVCNATSPAQADVLAALPAAGNTNTTVVVNIPAGTAQWSSGFSYTVPAAVTSLTIQGKTNIAWTGTAGASDYGYTVNDQTVIQDVWASNGTLMTFVVNGTAKFRFTGLTLEGGTISGSQGQWSKYPFVDFKGSSPNIRADDNHINNNTYSPWQNTNWFRAEGTVLGVVDHNVFDMGGNQSIAGGVSAFDPGDDPTGIGDQAWADASLWGSGSFLFIESNYFTGAAPNDCAAGARFVMRYNTLNAAYVAIQTHATKSSAGPPRGCRAFEAYHNYITGPVGAATGDSPIGSKIGPALIWGNSMPQGYYKFFTPATDRQSGATTETNTPDGWGYCGTSVKGNGVGSQWDGNAPNGSSPTSSGYPCLDGIGRGQTQQALNDQPFPNRLNSATHSIAWPQQYLEPVYLFGNDVHPASGVEVEIRDTSTKFNQDVYYECGSLNPDCSNGFTGAKGTGSGTLASRPSSCTAGAGGKYGASPTGSYGVAYWATDTSTLYACTARNVWTAIYTPFVYPHPLVSGGGGGGGGGQTVQIVVDNIGNGSADGCNGPHAAGTAFQCTLTGIDRLVSIAGCGGTLAGDTYSGTATANCTITAQFLWRYAETSDAAQRGSGGR